MWPRTSGEVHFAFYHPIDPRVRQSGHLMWRHSVAWTPQGMTWDMSLATWRIFPYLNIRKTVRWDRPDCKILRLPLLLHRHLHSVVVNINPPGSSVNRDALSTNGRAEKLIVKRQWRALFIQWPILTTSYTYEIIIINKQKPRNSQATPQHVCLPNTPPNQLSLNHPKIRLVHQGPGGTRGTTGP